MDPLQPVVFEGERPEKRRGVAQRVDGGAEVVHKAGERGLGGAGAAADCAFGLDDGDGATAAGELDGGREAVGAGANHDSVVGASSGHVLLDPFFDRRSAATNVLR